MLIYKPLVVIIAPKVLYCIGRMGSRIPNNIVSSDALHISQ